MAQRKVLISDDGGAALAPAARLADDSDRFVASPVRAMQQTLWAFAEDNGDHARLGDHSGALADEPALYPGWIRLMVPLVLSAMLWGLIFGVARALGVFGT